MGLSVSVPVPKVPRPQLRIPRDFGERLKPLFLLRLEKFYVRTTQIHETDKSIGMGLDTEDGWNDTSSPEIQSAQIADISIIRSLTAREEKREARTCAVVLILRIITGKKK